MFSFKFNNTFCNICIVVLILIIIFMISLKQTKAFNLFNKEIETDQDSAVGGFYDGNFLKKKRKTNNLANSPYKKEGFTNQTSPTDKLKDFVNSSIGNAVALPNWEVNSVYKGCYYNYPRKVTGWDPNDLSSDPSRNTVCYNRSISTNSQFWGLENDNGCLMLDQANNEIEFDSGPFSVSFEVIE